MPAPRYTAPLRQIRRDNLIRPAVLADKDGYSFYCPDFHHRFVFKSLRVAVETAKLCAQMHSDTWVAQAQGLR